MTGLSRDRVAELIVTTPDGRQRGSGYRVTTDAVLTAAHVLADAESVVVRFSPDLPDEWTVEASSWWIGSSDLAVVTISGEPVPPALFGRVGDRAAVIAVQSVGFPLWKFRSSYRDAFHATGTVAVLSNWRSGTLEFSLSPAPDAAWNGMSGAALWSGDRIVGVITAHHSSDGPARLEATRVDQALLDRLGVSAWPDVVPEAPADRVLSAYREQLSETAPSVLLDRAEELDSLVRFCAGDAPYLWLQAGPWAGKSALLSSFVLHYLPRGVDVVSFFITSRYAGQSDSDAFTESMIEQLAALVDEPSSTLVQSPARRGHLARLLREAAQRSVEAGRRLLLVVDGLDEDTGQSSIAALLPSSVPPGVRVLVASRPHPGLPDDVPPDHPLRALEPSPLTGSAHARDIAVRAKHELRAALKGSEDERTVLGLITASGGGLTSADIEEATGWAPYRIDSVLEGRLARSLSHRPSSSLYVFSHETLRELALQQLGTTLDTYRDQLHAWADRYQGWPATTPIYLMRGYPRMLAASGNLARLFALATDRDRHERLLEYSGGDALAQIEIANATNLAAQHQDIGALLILAVLRDELADRNSRIPYDLPAVWVKLGEPTRALALAQGIAEPTRRANALIAMAEAAYPDDQYRVDRRVVDKVEREIRKLEHPGSRDRAFMALVKAAAHAGWHDDAVRMTAAIHSHDWKLEAGAARAVASGDLDLTEQLVREIRGHFQRARASIAALEAAVARRESVRVRNLAQIAEHALQEEYPGWDLPGDLIAELACLVGVAGDGEYRDKLLTELSQGLSLGTELPILVRGAIAEGDTGRARRLIEDAEGRLLSALEQVMSDPPGLARGELWDEIAAAAQAMAVVGDFDGALRFAGEIARPEKQDEALAKIARSLADTGDHERGERLAETITTPQARARAMTWIAASRQGAEARRLVVSAEHHARHAASSWLRGFVVAELVKHVSATGAREVAKRLALAAERFADRVTPGPDKAYALCAVIEATDAILGREHTRRLAAQARAEARSGVGLQPENAERQVVVALAKIGDIDGAEQFALETRVVPDRLPALAEAVSVVAEAGYAEGARRLVTVMEREFQEYTSFHPNLSRPYMVKALIAAGDYERARYFADDQSEIHSAIAIALADRGDHDSAHNLALSAWQEVQSVDAPWAKRPVVAALAAVGEFDAAVSLARVARIEDWAGPVAVRLAQAGHVDRAEQLIAEIKGSSRSAIFADVAEVAPDEVARRLVIEALASENWQPAVGPAAKLIGRQVVEIAEYLLDQ